MNREITGIIGLLCLESGIWLYSPRFSVVSAGIILIVLAIVIPDSKTVNNKTNGRV